MKKILLPILLLIVGISMAQTPRELPAGYPDRSLDMNPEQDFATPPKGYGQVPFYWWMGDTLTREHLTWHLDILAEKKISSLQINYAHTDKGGITYGVTIPSKPALFSDAWWELFGWFMKEAKSRGMTVSLSDYTLGVGQGSYVDDMLAEDAAMNGFELQFRSDTLSGGRLERQLEVMPLSMRAYSLDDHGALGAESADLLPMIKDSQIAWTNPWPRTVVTTVVAKRKLPSLDPMHPQSGVSYVRHFFQKFEDKFPEEAKGGLNFFFSDELSFNLWGNIWNDIFAAEFLKRKGYDITPYLDALFVDRGDITPKIRLDYNDVRVALSEENFFIPVYNWHQERELLFGCDHGGRGMDVSEFGDYFRTQRWNQAPGCDQPMLQKNIIKNKVASSISHLYERERVWLEGFHSSNWSTNSEQLTDAIFANFAMGQNLLSLHGLYYSTAGGWWEWAAPCNHFHQPYWKEMEGLLECTERLSYILSQGYHSADVAVLYPVEPVVAGYGDRAVQTAFGAGEYLYKNGIDFDFMDYESLARAEIEPGYLAVAGERFRILVVPSMKAIRHASLEKMLAFKEQGGIIINLGDLPEATEQNGRNDLHLKQLVDDIFASDTDSVFCLEQSADMLPVIDSLITRDFRRLDESAEIPYVMHRHIGGKELYAVYNVDKGAECLFRAKGAVSLWNPWTGTTEPLAVDRVIAAGTVVRMPLNRTDMQLLFFDPAGAPAIAEVKSCAATEQIALDGEWRFELEPLLDNRFGDFQWPATDEMMGAYLYKANYEGREESFSYGTKFLLLEATPALSEAELLSQLPTVKDGVRAGGRYYAWKPYQFSWRWGVEGDYGHQGWHGLKTEMYNDFIRLGKIRKTDHALERVADDNGNKDYYLYTQVQAPRKGVYAVEYGDMKPATLYINGQKVASERRLQLKKGLNEVVLHYDSYGTTHFVIRDGAADIEPQTRAEAPLRMKFRGDKSLLLFDVRQKADTRGEFSFETAPGLEKLEFSAYGDAAVTVGGVKATMSIRARRADGLISYMATLPERVKGVSKGIIDVKERWGYAGGSAIDGPVKQICGEGVISIGDWAEIDGLKAYSGGAWYRNEFTLDTLPMNDVTLDLGAVISTAEVWINGVKVGCRLSSPWSFEILKYLRAGENRIEVLVCNTAANHYLSTPTAYRGGITSGIFGPVTLTMQKR